MLANVSPAEYIWIYLVSSETAQLFTISLASLVLGLTLDVWYQAIYLQQFDVVSLHDVEAKHPHIPSLKNISSVIVYAITLFVVIYMSHSGIPPFDKPYRSLILASIFIFAATGGVLHELKHSGTKQLATAACTGTLLAYIFLGCEYSFLNNHYGYGIALVTIFFASLVVVGKLFFHRWEENVQVTCIGAFIFWLFVYLLQ